MKTTSLLMLFALFIAACHQPQTENIANRGKEPVDLVNPFIGTAAHGHTYPGATLPFGMVQLSPDTRLEGWDGCSGYHYSDSVVFGFSHTHLSGTGVPDYCDVLLMPATGDIFINNCEADHTAGYASRFSHDKETAGAGYYKTHLDDYNIDVELTATKRSGIHRYTFKSAKKGHLIIDLVHRDKVVDSWLEIVNDTLIQGFRRSSSWAVDQYVYFAAVLSQPMIEATLFQQDEPLKTSKTAGKSSKGYFGFNFTTQQELIVKVGISAVSAEGALQNLKTEIPGWDFDKVHNDAREAWNRELKKIEVKGGSENQKITFYTALYHAFLAPNLYHDVDGSYRGRDLKIHHTKAFDYHTVFSLWDTYRAAHPLFTLVQQKRTYDFINTMLAQYDEGGRLPVWELAANETECMIGYHAVPVIADAYLKGLKNFDVDKALKAMQHSASMDHFGLKHYKKNGYISADEESESVSKTLEYAYDDWCIAMMAKEAGENKIYEEYIKRAQSWKNVFDPQTGFMRAKMKGGWFEPFDPREVNFNYTEANAWQYSFYMPQDISGFIQFLGGSDSLEARLDRLFTSAPKTTGRHQSDITGLIGQYAHGNEPSHHMAYLYNYIGKPGKTQSRIRQIMDNLYTHLPDGLCGNEDCGQMSAWYVMSAMGFYPVTPGITEYAIGSPLFEEVTLHLENGNMFTITAENNSSENTFIQSAELNGETYTKSFLSHDAILAGGKLELTMGSTHSDMFGIKPGDLPVSGIKEYLILPVPFTKTGSRIFPDTTTVSMGHIFPEASIHYTIDGTEPDRSSQVYVKPILLSETTKIKAKAIMEGFPESPVLSMTFNKVPAGKTITLNTEYAGQYAAGGDLALIDHIRGPADFKTGAWQGYHGINLDAVIDLGAVKQVNTIETGFLQDAGAWIFMPLEVSYLISKDGNNYQKVGSVKNIIESGNTDIILKNFTLEIDQKARYIRVIGENRKVCPDWHVGKGEPAWIFADEIKID